MKNPYWVFLGNIGLIAVICTAVAAHYQMGDFGFAMSISVGWFTYGNLFLAMSFTWGYGVKGTRTVAGMPMALALPIAVIGTVITLLLVETYQPSTLQATTVADIRTVGWSAAVGVATAVSAWYSYGRQAYFGKSEGDSPQVT